MWETETILLALLTLAVSGRAISYAITYTAGRWTSERETGEEELRRRLKFLERSTDQRFDQASKEMSKLAGYYQGLQDWVRKEFMPREALQAELQAAREAREQLWTELNRLRNGR